MKTDGKGLRLLLDLLLAYHVVTEEDNEIRLTERFSGALRSRDLLEAKLDFSLFAARDVLYNFAYLVRDPGEFMRRASMLRLFDYSRCFDNSPGSRELTRRWMRFTTILTRYEARACLKYHDLGAHLHMLDIGGNSGEFALQVCKKNAGIQVAIFDLPLVCDIGREHVRPEPEADRISFFAGNAVADPIPGGFDLITFKSILHDWPVNIANHLILKACDALAPGGTILIFERGPLEVAKKETPFSMVPFLLFAHSFRSPEVYRNQLEELGLLDISVSDIDLETPFFLITARKAGQTIS